MNSIASLSTGIEKEMTTINTEAGIKSISKEGMSKNKSANSQENAQADDPFATDEWDVACHPAPALLRAAYLPDGLDYRWYHRPA